MDAIDLPITIDVAEKLPYDFRSVQRSRLSWCISREHLATGDYSIRCHPLIPQAEQIVIERKTLADLYGSMGGKQGLRRTRLEREFGRMSQFGFAAIVIEAGIEHVANPGDRISPRSRINPRSVIGSLIAWEQRYGVHVHFVGCREIAEQWVFRQLERWQRDQIAKAKQSMRGIATKGA